MLFAISALALLAQTGAARHARRAADVLGAVYTLSNSPDGNHVVASYITSNGTLEYAGMIATGGKGGIGAVSPPAAVHPDPLFSQHPIIVAGDHVFAVNAGSNTLSMFLIDNDDPTKLELVTTANTGGSFPVAVASSVDCSTACVLTSAGSSGVRCFAVGERSLTHITGSDVSSLGLNQTNPPAGPGLTVSDILFDNAGNVVVAVKGTPTAPGHLTFFPTKASSGYLTMINPKDPVMIPASKGALPFGMSNSFEGHSFFVTDPAVGVTTYTLDGESAGKVPSNATTTAVPIAGQGATCWSARSPVTKSFFSVDPTAGFITEFSFSNAGVAKMIKTYHVNSTAAITDATVGSTSKGDFLYGLAGMHTAVVAWSVGTTPGELHKIQTMNFAKEGVTGLNAAMAGAAAYAKS